MMNRRKALPGLLLCMLATGCGQEMLAGGIQKGEASAVVTDDPGSGGAPAGRLMSARRSVVPLGDGARLVAALPQGTVTVQGSVVLLRAGGDPAPLGPGTGSARVRLAAADSAALGSSEVEVGGYTRARITFTSVVAEVSGGVLSTIGVPLVGTVRVLLPEPLVVEAPLALTVREEGEHRVTIDLNAEAWLAAADPALLTVPAAAFGAALRVSAR